MATHQTDLSTDMNTTGYDVNDIRNRLPNSLSDEQERAMIAAIRNPDADVSEIATATAVEAISVRHALDSIACGVLGADEYSDEWVEDRDGVREAETYAELTEKQQAVIDYLARTPGFAWRDEASRTLAAGIENADKGAAASIGSVHYTYPKKVAEQYEGLIAERRHYLVENETLDLDADVPDVDDSALRPGTYDAPRDLLERAGYDLPDSNLDDLETKGEALPDDERLDLAFKRGTEVRDAERDAGGHLGPLSCPECGAESVGTLACPECRALKIHDGAVPVGNHLGERRPEFSPEDVRKGVIYRGIVNGVEPFGLFVTIGGHRNDTDDVSGLMHRNTMPVDDDGNDPTDYNVGETVHVVKTGTHTPDDGGETTPTFEWPTEDRVRPHLGAAEGEDESDDERAETDREGETMSKTTTTTTEATDDESRENGDLLGDPDELTELLREQNERLDALERENERLREQVSENGEALPTPEQAQELNESAETVLDADERLGKVEHGVKDLRDDMAGLRHRVQRVEGAQSDTVAEALDLADGEVENLADRVADIEDTLADMSEWSGSFLDPDAADPESDDPPATVGDVIGALTDLRERVEQVETIEPTTTGESDLADALETLREYGIEGDLNINL